MQLLSERAVDCSLPIASASVVNGFDNMAYHDGSMLDSIVASTRT